MGIEPIDQQVVMLGDFYQGGKAADGSKVIVKITGEALKDYGQATCWQAACAKFAAGKFEELSGNKHVWVSTEYLT